MVLMNTTSIFATTFNSYTTYVFGSPTITSVMFLLILLVIALVIRIPFPISISLLIPLTLVLLAIGYLPLLAGGIVVISLMIIAGFSFSKNMM